MKALLLKYIIISFFAASAGSAFTIYTNEIKKINTPDNAGPYNKFLKKIEKRTSFNFDVEFLPFGRSFKKFKKDSGSCIFPFSKDDTKEISEDIVLSKALGSIELYAISLKGDFKVTKANHHKMKNVAIRSMYKSGIKFVDDRNYFFVTDEKQLFSMLERGRVDYILESVPDIYLYFKNGKAGFDKTYHYDNSYLIKEVREYMACHKKNKSAEVLIKYLKSL